MASRRLTSGDLFLFTRWLERQLDERRHSCERGGTAHNDSDQCAACHEGPRPSLVTDADLVMYASQWASGAGEPVAARTFPVLWQGNRVYLKTLSDLGCPRSVPWAFIAEHAEWCQHNHGQSQERLAERGGLSPEEIVAVVRNTRLHVAEARDYFHDPPKAVAMLKEALAVWADGPRTKEDGHGEQAV